jgi:hypothetical protein
MVFEKSEEEKAIGELTEAVESVKAAVLHLGELVKSEGDGKIGWNRPEPISYSPKEGTGWIPWGKTYDIRPRELHAIRFSDGSIFDMVNGWRKPR